MLDVALVLQDAEVGADGRVARRVRHGRADLVGRGRAEPVDGVEDFALAEVETGEGHVKCESVSRWYGLDLARARVKC